jgi:hypothetical protein
MSCLLKLQLFFVGIEIATLTVTTLICIDVALACRRFLYLVCLP